MLPNGPVLLSFALGAWVKSQESWTSDETEKWLTSAVAGADAAIDRPSQCDSHPAGGESRDDSMAGLLSI